MRCENRVPPIGVEIRANVFIRIQKVKWLSLAEWLELEFEILTIYENCVKHDSAVYRLNPFLK